MFAAIAIYFVILFVLIKKGSLILKYSLLWMLAGVLMLVFAIWPGILTWLTSVLGIALPVNALFAMMFFCIIMILMSLTSIVSKQKEELKILTQQMAILEKELRDLKDK